MAMLFDDRLGTVLRMRASSLPTRRIQLRQIIDLLGTGPGTAQGPAVEAAYARLGELLRDLPVDDAAALLRDRALRLRNPRIVAALGSADARLAAAALERADLHEEQWLDLIPALPAEARQALHQRGDLPPAVRDLLARLGVRGRGLPPAPPAADQIAPAPRAPRPAPAEPVATPPTAIETPSMPSQPPQTAAALSTTRTGPPVIPQFITAEVLPTALPVSARSERIGAIVKRIEAYRRAKQVVDHGGGDAPRLPLGEEASQPMTGSVNAVDFATDSRGRITWCEAALAPMLVGQPLGSDQAIAQLIRKQQPLSAQTVWLGGAAMIAGRWQIDATPWFDPLAGRFVGYRGRLRRPAGLAPQVQPLLPDSEADRIRQMLHELRTPVNAIQMGAEIIQQQLYGPSPHEYRALAAAIAVDAARILAAFDELDRLAKLDSGVLDLEPGHGDLALVLQATAGQLDAHTRTRGSGFDLRFETTPALTALAPIELERVVWRVMATLAGTSAPGERLKLRLRRKDDALRADVSLPASLARMDDETLFAAGPGTVPQVVAAGMFGTGFALRLARAEARAAKGDLRRKGARLRLSLPGLTNLDLHHTHGSPEVGHKAS